MKVLHIINNLEVGGAQKLLLDTLPMYNSAGIVVDLLIFKSEESIFLKALKAQNCCNIIELNLNSVYNPLAIFKIIKYLKHYDIAHVHLFPAFYFVGFAKCLSFSKIKLVYTEHSTSNRRMENSLFGLFDKLIYSLYTKVICVSEKVKEILSKHTFQQVRKIVLIENGVKILKIKNATPLTYLDLNLKGLDQNDTLLLQVSSFQNPKDQSTVIKAMQYLPDNIKLLLVGEGVLLNKSKNLVDELHLNSRIFFLRNRSDIPNLLKSVHLNILSSKYEGLPLYGIEAMASGKPFIASDVNGLKQMVKDAGVLFEHGNHKELAALITKLLNDEILYNSVVNACQKRAASYNIKFMIEKHLKLYQSIFSSN